MSNNKAIKNGDNTLIPLKEKRNFNRETVDLETYIVPVGQTQKLNCLTCNISEGGIKILTDKKLDSEKYNIIMANQKFPIRIIYGGEIENNKFLYGVRFTKPISILLKKEIILNLNKKNSAAKAGMSPVRT